MEAVVAGKARPDRSQPVRMVVRLDAADAEGAGRVEYRRLPHVTRPEVGKRAVAGTLTETVKETAMVAVTVLVVSMVVAVVMPTAMVKVRPSLWRNRKFRETFAEWVAESTAVHTAPDAGDTAELAPEVLGLAVAALTLPVAPRRAPATVRRSRPAVV